MFKKNFSYFNNVPIQKTYPKSVNVVTWDWQAPPEALLKKVSLENQKYIKKIQVATIQKRNFQDEIQKVICLTPEKIFKSGITLKNDNVSYQQQELSGLNATDAVNVAKAAATEAVKKQAATLTESDIQKAIEQYKAKQAATSNKGEVK